MISSQIHLLAPLLDMGHCTLWVIKIILKMSFRFNDAFLLVPHRWNRWGLSPVGDYRFALCPSVRHTRFPDFSSLCSYISEWKLVASFYMKSYRSSLTFVTVDLLFHELLPFVQNSFSGLFFTLLSHIWMKVCRKLPYEELQIKFDFRHGWPTFSWVIALSSKFVFRHFLHSAFTYLNESL